MELPMLPDDIIQSIIVMCESTTFVSCRCLSKFWNAILVSNEVVSDHLFMHYGKTILLHLKNPLLEMRMGRISLFDLHKGLEIHLRFPVPWEWFDIIACCNGFICARFSYDRMSTHIVIWNLITNTKRFIDDLGSENACRNMFSKNLAVYTFFHVPDDTEFGRAALLQPRVQSTSAVLRFNMHSGSWIELLIPDYALHSFFPRLISNGQRLFFVDVDPCGLIYGLHSHEIIIDCNAAIQWGPSRLCPFAYISQTPTIMLDDMILGLIHAVSDADIIDPSFEGALSDIKFSIIDLENQDSFIVSTMRSNSIIGVSRVFQYTPNINQIFGCT
ncbi:hypothetical protein PIB30_066625 [Stylosanthes scabra]|uniref:F-box domain-containing protein n=1 Tax=Stylosanthes scabra TaxID=79078 RepID=A0ABU6UL84_9FABA|nr:hypothetical protein [Stylosanthes scabra]